MRAAPVASRRAACALGQRVAVEHGDFFEMGRDSLAAARPPIPAPMTTACLAIELGIGVSPSCAVSKAH